MIFFRTIKKTVPTKKAVRNSLYYNTTASSSKTDYIFKNKKDAIEVLDRGDRGVAKLQKNETNNTYRIVYNGICCLAANDYVDIEPNTPCGIRGNDGIDFQEESLLIIEADRCFKDDIDAISSSVVVRQEDIKKLKRIENLYDLYNYIKNHTNLDVNERAFQEAMNDDDEGDYSPDLSFLKKYGW